MKTKIRNTAERIDSLAQKTPLLNTRTKQAIGFGVAVLVVVLAIWGDDVFGADGFSDDKYARVQVSGEECRNTLGYIDCGGGYVFVEKKTAPQNWCHVAWSGLPDQYRDKAWEDLPEPLRSTLDEESFLDAGDERVLMWRRNYDSQSGGEWIFWGAWESDEQRDWRERDGWKPCDQIP